MCAQAVRAVTGVGGGVARPEGGGDAGAPRALGVAGVDEERVGRCGEDVTGMVGEVNVVGTLGGGLRCWFLGSSWSGGCGRGGG